MATPTYSEVINQVNTFIVTNGNNEITAAVLNPVLKFITDFANNHMGDLSTLTTSEAENLVSAINSLKQNFDDLSNNGVQLYTGVPNPNVTPPATYNYADFYMQIDFLTSEPITLWQWNGFEWKDSSSVPATESDNVTNNSSVPGITVTDALDHLNSTANNFPKIQFTADGFQSAFDLGTNSLANIVFWNGVPLDDADWSQNENILTLTFVPDAGTKIKPI